MELRIAHLYAHFLNIYGDRGNIVALSKRAMWRDIDVEIKAIDLKDEIDPDYWDLYFIGGGQDKQQIVIAEDLLASALGDEEGSRWQGGGWLARVLPEKDALRTAPLQAQALRRLEDGGRVGEEAAIPEVGAAAFEDMDVVALQIKAERTACLVLAVDHNEIVLLEDGCDGVG